MVHGQPLLHKNVDAFSFDWQKQSVGIQLSLPNSNVATPASLLSKPNSTLRMSQPALSTTVGWRQRFSDTLIPFLTMPSASRSKNRSESPAKSFPGTIRS